MKHFILTKVHSSSVATEPKDLERGLGFIAVIESTQKLGEAVVPLFIKCKSAIKLEAGEHLLEVEVFNISQNGARPQTYYRILRKAELGGKK